MEQATAMTSLNSVGYIARTATYPRESSRSCIDARPLASRKEYSASPHASSARHCCCFMARLLRLVAAPVMLTTTAHKLRCQAVLAKTLLWEAVACCVRGAAPPAVCSFVIAPAACRGC